ncbi:MAG: hypothetical protein AAF773_25865 [Cyanobacteria bacterium P01_D01_bin.115]
MTHQPSDSLAGFFLLPQCDTIMMQPHRWHGQAIAVTDEGCRVSQLRTSVVTANISQV